jgi:uncharacterized protein (DUF58 family)
MTGLSSLTPERTPARPGPGPLAEAALRALELSVRRRVDGLLEGVFRSPDLAAASELAQIREYEPGDDVRQIDWNATARTGRAHVRVHVAERTLTSWILLDTSPSMEFGTADRRKADVAEGVVLATGYVASRRGNRLGVLTFGRSQPVTRRPLQGRAGLVATLLALRGADEGKAEGPTALGDALERAGRVARQRGHIVLLTDLRGPRDWAVPLTRLAARHDVLVVEIRDPREDDLGADSGELVLADPESGRQLRVDTSDVRLRRRFAEAAAAERAEVARAVLHSGADHLVLSTQGDWLKPLLAAHERRRRGR